MKKILAVILSLAMILSMTVVGFAAEENGGNDTAIEGGELVGGGDVVEGGEVPEGGEVVEGEETGEPDGSKPTDPEDAVAWTAYYVVLLTEVTSDPTAVTTAIPEIANTVLNNEISLDAFKVAFPEAAKTVGGDLVNQVVWGVESLLSMDLNSDNYIGKPTTGEDNGELPEDPNGGGLLGDLDINDLLNTVLGFIGTIADMIFNPDSSEPSDPGNNEEPWPSDPTDPGTSTIPDTGDTTVFAVAAVALAAGAALVMTRKKSEDAE